MNRRRIDRSVEGAERGHALRRFFAFFVKFVGTVSVTALVVYGAVSGWAWLRTDPRFAVRHVELPALRHADPAVLAARAGLQPGVNIFQVDLAAAAHAMEEDPWVAHVRLARELPDTLRVAVDEREPVALVSIGGLYLVDAQGLFFKRALAHDAVDLPVVTGLTRDVVAGERRDEPGLRAALALVQAYGAHPMSNRLPLAEVNVGEEAGEQVFTLFAGDEPVEVRLGAIGPEGEQDAAQAFDRLARVWGELDRRGGRAARIDLGNRQRPDWVAVRLQDLN